MRSILRLPKLPKLNSKVVGILVIAAVLVLVFALQKSPDGFQNSSTLSVERAEALLINARNALASAVDELNSVQERATAARNKLNVKEQELMTAQSAIIQMKSVVNEAMNSVKRIQIDLELKQKAVQMAEQALNEAKRAARIEVPVARRPLVEPPVLTQQMPVLTAPPTAKAAGTRRGLFGLW